MRQHRVALISEGLICIHVQSFTLLLPGHDSLSVRANIQNNLHDLGFKAHIQHTVGLIQDLFQSGQQQIKPR